MKKLIALSVLIILILSVSGCFGKNLCDEIEIEMANENITCKCSTTDFEPFTPEEVGSKIDEVTCYCLCFKDGVSVKVVVLPNETSS